MNASIALPSKMHRYHVVFTLQIFVTTLQPQTLCFSLLERFVNKPRLETATSKVSLKLRS